MVKNKLVIDPHGRNHFKFFPNKVKEEEWLKLSEKEQIETVEKVYKQLLKEGEIIYEKVKKGSHSIKCIKLEDFYYIVVCIVNEFKTYNNSIYEIKSENDAIAISKFIANNIRTTMSDYKKQILDAKKMVVERKENEDSERNKNDENN